MGLATLERMFDLPGGEVRLAAFRTGLAAQLEEQDLLERFGIPVDLTPAAATLTAAASADMTALADHDLLQTASRLEDARRVLDAASARVLAELDTRGTTDHDRGLRTATWLAATARLAPSVARARVRLATELRARLPEVVDAWTDGVLGEQHARLLANAAGNPRIVEVFTPMVPDIIDDARTMAFDVWRAKLTALVALLDADGPAPADPTSDNHLSWGRGLDGRWQLRGEFDAVTGAAIREALDERAERLFRARHRDEQLAEADLPTPSHRRLLAQALHDMARNDVAANSHRATAAEIVLHLDAADPAHLVDDSGIRIGDTQRHTLTCDPLLHGIVFGMHATVLEVAKEQRLVSRAQRRAMDRRDGGCVFPGCDAPATWTDAHHVIHWQHGGPTELSNLASLCRHHHGVTHRSGWTMGTTDDEWFWWITPTGTFLWSQRHGIPRNGVPPDLALG